jgi:hypothetical protein
MSVACKISVSRYISRRGDGGWIEREEMVGGHTEREEMIKSRLRLSHHSTALDISSHL